MSHFIGRTAYPIAGHLEIDKHSGGGPYSSSDGRFTGLCLAQDSFVLASCHPRRTPNEDGFRDIGVGLFPDEAIALLELAGYKVEVVPAVQEREGAWYGERYIVTKEDQDA